MTIREAVILGVVQGLTEFLPVSSSGHLVFFQHLLGLTEPLIAFDIAVHLGTLLAVFVYFRKDIALILRDTFTFLIRFASVRNRDVFLLERPYALVGGLVVVTTLVTVMIAVAFEGLFRSFFESILAVGVAWIAMGGILMLSRKFQKGQRTLFQMNHRDAFLIGLAQAVAIIPGISRAGSTILAGMACGVEKEAAARYSFFSAVTVILAAAVLGAKEGVEFFSSHPQAMIAGFLTSAVVGYFAILFLMRVIRSGKFFLFGLYCLGMGVLAFGVSFL